MVGFIAGDKPEFEDPPMPYIGTIWHRSIEDAAAELSISVDKFHDLVAKGILPKIPVQEMSRRQKLRLIPDEYMAAARRILSIASEKDDISFSSLFGWHLENGTR